jgi:hypothetical protein
MKILDHTSKTWLARRKRTNGAETYSKDLVRYQVPNWRARLGEQDLLSTCPRIRRQATGNRYGRVIQYLHVFPFTNPAGYAAQSVAVDGRTTPYFITAYRQYQRLLTAAGLKAMFIPMAIDVDDLQRFRQLVYGGSGRIIWFGNIDQKKRSTYHIIRSACEDRGIVLDTITNDRYNGRPIKNRQELFTALGSYAYGVGVGRCALEMYALGLKVLIAGNGVGGVCLNDEAWSVQLGTNFNARLATFSADPQACLDVLPVSYIGAVPDIAKMDHAQLFTEEFGPK